MVPLFKKAISERPNQLTYLHLYNSHSFYCNRYPKDFKHFEKYATFVEYGRLIDLKRVSARMLNCYDNTIYYADQVLEQLISELDQRKNPSVLMYVADHSEEVIDARTHNSAVFTFDMINIPLVVWANQAWRDKHAQIWNTLQQNSQKVVTNDFMFESALGLAGIKAPPIDQENNISSSNYTEPSEPLTLHGRTKINHPNNWNYWQQQNIRAVQERDLDLVAINIESLGEAKIALSMGINHLQMNVEASESDGLVITANGGEQTIAPLKDFIKAFKESDSTSPTLAVTVMLNTNSEKLDEYISELENQTSLKIIKAPKNEIEAISLASPGFVKAIDELDLGNSDASSLVPITLSSRYTNPPPTPAEQ